MTTAPRPTRRVHRRAARFREAIRDFASARAGRQEQRERLTNGYTELHSQEIYAQARRARLARGLDPRGLRRLGRRHGRRVHLPRGDDARPDADRGLRRQPDRRRRLRALRHRRAEAGDPRRDRQRPGRGDRDVRARGGLRRRQPLLQGGAPERRLRPQRPEDLDLGRPHRRPHPGDRPLRLVGLEARGADDALGADRRRGDRDPRVSRRWAARRSTTSSSPTATSRRSACWARSTAAGCS